MVIKPLSSILLYFASIVMERLLSLAIPSYWKHRHTLGLQSSHIIYYLRLPPLLQVDIQLRSAQPQRHIGINDSRGALSLRNKNGRRNTCERNDGGEGEN